MDTEKKYRCKDRLKVRHLSKHHIITTNFSVCMNLEILVRTLPSEISQKENIPG